MKTMGLDYHIPVLLQPSIDALKIQADGVYIDATFGAGGHSLPILNMLSAKGHLYGFDQDEDAQHNAFASAQFTLIKANYCHVHRFMRLYNATQVDGILADLGISSHQIDIPERGFSFRFDGPLDMRMNVDSELTAAHVLNQYREEELVTVLSEYGEVRNAKTLAKAMLASRSKRKFETTYQLNQLLDLQAMGPKPKYLAQVYQALRIEVNDEMQSLKQFLEDSAKLLKPGGRFVVISYHSLEDRLVKNLFKSGNADGLIVKDDFGNIQKPFKLINKEVILADENELISNPRSRSAKLRIAEKV